MGVRNLSAALVFFAGSLHAAQVCDLTFTVCPDKLSGGSITVPLDVISLDVRIPYCQAYGKIASKTSPSIMFVIDNSGSMDKTDPTNARFSVVTTLLDSIYAAIPNARVGAAIFGHRLSFDYRDNPFFQTLFPDDNTQHDSFIPLTPLDTTFGGDGSRIHGLDTLKALLKYTVSNGTATLVYNTKRPKERISTRTNQGGTDITLGFDAALEAMKSSPSPKAAQFIIFLSDGEPNVSDDIRLARKDAYVNGTNTPTTYTVFFDPKAKTAPQPIINMTNNIKKNNYSTSNPNSAIYTINLPGSQLQSLLQQSVLSQILQVPATGKAVTVSITGGPTQTTTTKPDGSHFLIASRMPLNAGTTHMQFKYDHTYLDTTIVPPLIRDTSILFSLNVDRSAGGTVGGNVAKSCRDQPGLALFSGDTSLTSVTAGQLNLEARLTPPTGSGCAGCTVQVMPSQSLDRETIPLVSRGAYLGGPFTREESFTPVPGDGKLQHLYSDSIVLIWTNPENPLDLVRRAYPYQMLPSTLALFTGGKRIDTITSDLSQLEVRLTRAPGVPCVNCTVQVSASASADKETVPLLLSGASFNGTFIRIQSITPIAADGKLQHLSTDSIVLAWTNPENPQDKVRKSYPFKSIPPAVALFAGGKQLDTITAAYHTLQIRLTLPSGEACNACAVQVFPSGSADREKFVMSGSGSPYIATFVREVSTVSGVNNGKLEHLPKDSIVLFYQNPLDPSQQVRRSYLYIDFNNIIGIAPHNDVAKTSLNQTASDTRQWIISDAPNLVIHSSLNSGSCCRVLPTPADARSPDSSSTVGIIVEASREFTLDLNVFSNLGQFVNHVNFTVPRSEFVKLSPVAGKDSRYLRLLWNGLAKDGSRAGTGAYIFRTSITLLPMPGIADMTGPTTSTRRFGILRAN